MIHSMDDLPQTANSFKPNISSNQTTVGGANKEVESHSTTQETRMDELGSQEMDIPKEVSAAGVKTTKTTVNIPGPVSQMGVKASGTNVPISAGASITLPLTDDQIAEGLNQGITSSWRWLAVWCVRKLKQLHFAVKNIHGKLTKTKI